MKFGKEFASQMVPEWQTAYMDYNKLKGILKEILQFKQQRNPAKGAPQEGGLKRKITMYRAFSGLTRRYSPKPRTEEGESGGEEQVILVNAVERGGEGVEKGSGSESSYETMFLRLSDDGGENEVVFFKRLDEEFNKVNEFYKAKEEEMVNEAHSLNRQMDALIPFRLRVENPHHTTPFNWSPTTPTMPNTPGPGKAAAATVHMDAIQEVEMSSEEYSGEGNEEDETGINATKPMSNASNNGNQEREKKSKRPSSLQVLKHVKIKIPPETPRSTLKGMLMDSNPKELSFSKEELRKAEQQLKRAFIEFYQKLRILKSYSFLNLLAFSKIMKKYDKITSRSASRPYLNMVDNSYLGSSDEVTRLLQRVEDTFIKHFSNSNRKKGINNLRPTAKREKHRITFFLGFFSGCSISLLVVLILIVHVCKVIQKEEMIKPGEITKYMKTMFPLYSLFGFIVLHMLMYATNIYFWRRYRINYAFIFGFKQGTELGYKEVFLLSIALAVLTLAGVLANLDMKIDPITKDYKILTELVPLGLVTFVLLVTFCPFNIIYRSSRLFLLQSAFHCICAPLYKVTLPDFFLADQLTSQVEAIRSLQFYVCYYGWEDFKLREQKCTKYDIYITFLFIVAVIPYWARFLQCLRRKFEKKEEMQVYNGLKYFATIVAIIMRTAYDVEKRKVNGKPMSWRVVAGITTAIAAVVGTYWDLVIDWGLLQRKSKNRWLRDKLLISHKSVYFTAMVLNILLRFAWVESVIGFQVSFMHPNALTTTTACLEILRRGMWNFFRLENEHLNNVGKYRAFKSVPLPFNYDEDEDKDE